MLKDKHIILVIEVFFVKMMHEKRQLSNNLTALNLILQSDSEAIRTLDPRLRRALLYPAELRNHP